MSETPSVAPQQAQEDPRKKQLQDIQLVRDLFARAHDYLAQASHPGHISMKVAEVLNFLAFQYNDFKMRVETLEKQMKSEVDVVAAKAAADAVLGEKEVVKAISDVAANPPQA